MPTLALPPTLRDSSPVANALAIRRDAFGFFGRLAREAGDFAHYLTAAGETVYFINDPALVREVLVRQEDAFVKWAPNDSYWHFFGHGLLASEEPLHGKMQRIERPAFHHERLPAYARVIVETATEEYDRWSEGDLDLGRAMARVSLQIAARNFFSVSLDDCLGEFLDAVHHSQGYSARFGSSAADDGSFHLYNNVFIRVSRELLERRRRSGQSDADLLALLLQAQVIDGETVTDGQIVDEIRNILLAGHVTVANTMAAALWHVSRDPALQAAVHAEVDTALAGRAAVFDDLPALGLCERIFLETLRLYPPVWMLNKQTARAVQLGGHVLPADTKTLILPWILHRQDGRFPDPERFMPARWEDDLRSRLPRGSFIPFSAGSRSCLGERFAMLEGPLVLATILQRWRFSPPESTRPPFAWDPRIILWPRHGVWAAAFHRASSAS